MATENGVYRDVSGNLTSFAKQDNITGECFSSLLMDRKGAIWAGAEGGGLYRIKNAKVEQCGKSEGLRSDSVRSLQKDDEGIIWAGTAKGLSQYHDGGFRTLGLKEGLEDERVNQILDDGLGCLWFGGHSGIYRVKKNDLEDCLNGTTRSLLIVFTGAKPRRECPRFE